MINSGIHNSNGIETEKHVHALRSSESCFGKMGKKEAKKIDWEIESSVLRHEVPDIFILRSLHIHGLNGYWIGARESMSVIINSLIHCPQRAWRVDECRSDGKFQSSINQLRCGSRTDYFFPHPPDEPHVMMHTKTCYTCKNRLHGRPIQTRELIIK